MTMSKDWYNTEFEENELESKHRPPSVEYSFYTAVKPVTWKQFSKTAMQILLLIWKERAYFPEMRLPILNTTL